MRLNDVYESLDEDSFNSQGVNQNDNELYNSTYDWDKVNETIFQEEKNIENTNTNMNEVESDIRQINIERLEVDKKSTKKSTKKRLHDTKYIEDIKIDDKFTKTLGLDESNNIKIEFEKAKNNTYKDIPKVKCLNDKSKKKKDNSNILRNRKDPSINSYELSARILDKKKLIYINSLRWYNNSKGCFQEIGKHKAIVFMRKLLPNEYKTHMNSSTLEDAYKLILTSPDIQIKTDKIPMNRNKLNCKNGVLNLKQGGMSDHDAKYLFMNCINANYLSNSKIDGSCFQEFIKKITDGDLELERLIKQVIGYLLSNYNNAKTAFLLYGVPNSGKSILLKIINYICGDDNVSNIEFQYLSDKRYTASLFGKLLNISYELGETEITDTAIFKSLVSESDKVSARALYGQPFSFYNKAKLLFAANNLPNIKTKSINEYSAFTNRLCILPFTVSIPEEDQDRNLFNKLKREADLIFTWAVQGLHEYIDNGFKFSKCKASEVILNKYKARMNSAQLFLNQRCLIDVGNHTFMYDLKEAYENFCSMEGLNKPTPSDIKMLKSLIENSYELQYKRINRGGENKHGFENLNIINS